MSILDIKEENKEQWGPIDGRTLYQSFWMPAVVRTGKTKYKARWFSVVGMFESGRMTFVWDRKDSERRGRYAIEHFILKEKTQKKAWSEYKDIILDMKREARSLEALERKLKGKKLLDEVTKKASHWHDLMIKFWDYGLLPEVANYGASAYLKRTLIRSVPEDKMNDVLEVLLSPDRLSFHQEGEYELLKVSLVTDKGRKRRLMEAYTQKWFWVENSYFESKRLSIKDFENFIKELSVDERKARISVIEKYCLSVRQKKLAVCKKHALSREVVLLAKNLAFSIWWQDHRKAVAMWSQGIVDIFLRAAERQLSVPYDDIMMYLADEWKDLFLNQRKVSASILSSRKKLLVFSLDTVKARVTEFRGKDAVKVKSSLFTEHSASKDVNKISGTSVSKGKATGRVTILFSSREISKMKDGDVLVTSMTSPDFIAAMRKSSAIVTDVGGLTSHAAVVSRELGKPCIVGTKIATQALKDGDMVEVDADNGVVKKI